MELSEHKLFGRIYPTPRYFVEFLRSTWVWGLTRTVIYLAPTPRGSINHVLVKEKTLPSIVRYAIITHEI